MNSKITSVLVLLTATSSDALQASSLYAPTHAISRRIAKDVYCQTVESTTAAKDYLLSLMLDGLSVDSGTRNEMNEALLRLEKGNPTEQPTYSRLLNGVWELKFAGAPGPGLLDSPTREIALALYATGYSAGSLLQGLSKLPSPLASSLEGATVTITAQEVGQPRATTDVSLRLIGNVQHLSLRSNLIPMSDVRLREDLVEAEAFGQKTLVPGPLARTRQLFITFLDEELLVVRDESGVPDVLVRKQMFSGEDLGELSYEDDDASPGAS